jgi:hypothetical protein
MFRRLIRKPKPASELTDSHGFPTIWENVPLGIFTSPTIVIYCRRLMLYLLHHQVQGSGSTGNIHPSGRPKVICCWHIYFSTSPTWYGDVKIPKGTFSQIVGKPWLSVNSEAGFGFLINLLNIQKTVHVFQYYSRENGLILSCQSQLHWSDLGVNFDNMLYC